MYKLLTLKESEKIKKEYFYRRISLILALLSAVIIFTAVALTPSLIFVIKKKEASLFTLSAVNKPLKITGKENLETWVERTKVELAALSPDPFPDTPYVYIQKVLEKKSNDIILNSFIWSRANNGNKSMRLSGVAKTRQTLLSFQSVLSESGNWTQVELPVSAIAKETNIPFEISLVPQKPK